LLRSGHLDLLRSGHLDLLRSGHLDLLGSGLLERSVERRIVELLQLLVQLVLIGIERTVVGHDEAVMSRAEAIERFACFGGECAVVVAGDGPAGDAAHAAAWARSTLLAWHDRFSRFIAGSELSRLNDDPRPEVMVSPLMGYF